MTTATLSIDLNAIAANWQALNKMTGCDTGAVIKANAYGLGVDRVAPVLAAQGARKFFVAVAEEGVALRRVLGPGPAINGFAGIYWFYQQIWLLGHEGRTDPGFAVFKAFRLVDARGKRIMKQRRALL